MGHTTVITTMRYVDEVPEYQQKAMESMAEGMAFLLDDNPVDNPVTPNPPPHLRLFGKQKPDDEQSSEDNRALGLGA